MASKSKYQRWTLYRSGELETSLHYNRSDEWFEYMDKLCPRDKIARRGALYCSHNAHGALGWAHFAREHGDYERYIPLYKITYEGPEPHIYPVRLYDEFVKAYKNQPADLKEIARRYWKAGVGVDAFMRHKSEYESNAYWKGGTEILADPSYIIKAVDIKIGSHDPSIRRR